MDVVEIVKTVYFGILQGTMVWYAKALPQNHRVLLAVDQISNLPQVNYKHLSIMITT